MPEISTRAQQGLVTIPPNMTNPWRITIDYFRYTPHSADLPHPLQTDPTHLPTFAFATHNHGRASLPS